MRTAARLAVNNRRTVATRRCSQSAVGPKTPAALIHHLAAHNARPRQSGRVASSAKSAPTSPTLPASSASRRSVYVDGRPHKLFSSVIRRLATPSDVLYQAAAAAVVAATTETPAPPRRPTYRISHEFTPGQCGRHTDNGIIRVIVRSDYRPGRRRPFRAALRP
uniref:Uncharacterized protein n=1 Tax=Plectus sambesii TaxID=2011161 RepID=A0A914UM86_9BILA